jgi:hypothetical protein
LEKGPDAAKVINDIRRLGDNYSYESGLTIGLSDLSPLKKDRDEIMPDMLREIRSIPERERTQDKLGAIYANTSTRATRPWTRILKPPHPNWVTFIYPKRAARNHNTATCCFRL